MWMSELPLVAIRPVAFLISWSGGCASLYVRCGTRSVHGAGCGKVRVVAFRVGRALFSFLEGALGGMGDASWFVWLGMVVVSWFSSRIKSRLWLCFRWVSVRFWQNDQKWM